mmetsp:Transcript_32701/g.49283  ORF Transcript_32701/g.49283 Transcript_32701/m.49283 type:complete len:430 (+) Transcript_32701:45-1334(+)|eukprot:CAMPEP_0178918848 /NCGR_PEP_ID=MMETSP0786-20121207/14066_1 /TAXON_ID=186022 /ORGANISM="Thalassionema frauenfeldii, Strain CCMP 1798" /LENGTH=429 /DNA_ID=CAMNT_0020592627 /DNA_START=161 /DNA_END=1450 /DNA_ORIENTATION=-
MQLIVKTLKGEKFPIKVEPSLTVEQVKGIIESAKSELPAASMRLIFSGKVLKDSDPLESCGVKENDFLVVMVTKPKKAAAPAAAATTPAPTTPAADASKEATASTTQEANATPAVAAPAATPAAPERPAASEFPAEVVANLTVLGFPETEVRHCLRAAQGNPDVAVEFLTNGIPPGVNVDGGGASPSSGSGSSSSGGEPLQNLRNHPQFNDLRRLVQSNPAMLQQVLTQIGQQQPDLLREINENQALFLQMMNEPIESGGDSSPSNATSNSNSSTSAPSLPPGMAGDPEQMAQMMQNMEPGQLQMMAQMMGLTPEQVQAVGRMLGQLPREQLQEYMAQAMGGAGGAPGGPGGGQQLLRLNEEEMAAVDRLTEMGFDRADAAQAFLACDKNEALAANLLMDGGFDFGDAGNDGGNSNTNNDGNDDEDMYS